MKKNVRENTLKISTLDIILMCLTIYELVYFPHTIYIFIKYAILLYLFIKKISNFKHNKQICCAILLYGGIIFFSTIINQNSVNRYVSSFMYGFHIFIIFLTIYVFLKKRTFNELITIMYRFFATYIVVTDILMIFISYDFSGSGTMYFVGNKFTVTFLHLLFLVLYHLKTKLYNNDFKHRSITLLIWMLSLIITFRVTCTTGVLMVIFYGFGVLLPNKIKQIMSNNWIVVGSILFINFLIFGSYNLLSNQFVSGFISGVLGKSSTWLGRLRIYSVIFELISNKLWLGYGFYSNIVQEMVGFGNAQNGVLKILIDSGIIGLISYLYLLFLYTKTNKDNCLFIWPLTSFVYCSILASIPEISLTIIELFMVLTLIYCYKKLEVVKTN